MKFGFKGEKYIGGRTITASPSELNCKDCKKDLSTAADKYYCDENKALLCRRCTLDHKPRMFHYDMKIDKVEVEK